MDSEEQEETKLDNLILAMKSFSDAEMSDTIGLLEQKVRMNNTLYESLLKASEEGILKEVIRFVDGDLKEKQWVSPRGEGEAVEKNNKVMVLGSEICKVL